MEVDRVRPRFSVIIPVYNRAHFIEATLDSVFAQSYLPHEVIIVDDGSTDDSVRTVEGYGNRVQLIKQKNRGPAAARNRAATVATGDYLAFLDSDDLWFPWTLETFAECIVCEQDVTVVLGSYISFLSHTFPQSVARGEFAHVVYRDFYQAAAAAIWIGTGGICVKKSSFLAVGMLDEDFRNGEDLDLFLRLGVEPGFVVIESPVTFAYRTHDQNATQNFEATADGIQRLIIKEKQQLYPGGSTRRRERLKILTRFVRPPSLEAIRQRQYRDAFRFYFQTFVWHALLLRLKYLLGFWLYTGMRSVRNLFASRK